ncbi:nucleotide exchange factor GrpE [Limoniibacter endophyticus]|uniref:Protein GrpE n=1 Tax=Limoniibacter endophyticus TaxID=1565040 RepID=A0A8J3GJV1_9HYPH|nr:nucleotide exchange factor GrpE [Limoniibacter endophyticus]GHC80651.1 protein GrpE [Limoniibacter endophyticus]
MSDHANNNPAPEENPDLAAAGAAEANAAATEDNADHDTLVKLLKENEELKERALRFAADMENLRRRTQREVADASSYAVTNFARDMLTVSDNLRRAIDAVPHEERNVEGGLKSLIEGVELTERSMLSALERHGVKLLSPEGEKFDPNFHQAMFEVPNPDVPNNTVVQVVQPGYSIGARVLRPAMVGVAKGGPKEAPTPAQPEGTDGEEPGPINAQAEKDA